MDQNNQDTNDGEKNGEIVDLTGWNVEEKDGKDKDVDDDIESSKLLKSVFYFYYNMVHSLKMVIVKPYSDSVIENDVYRHWVKMASSYDISRKKDGNSEAIFYYNTIAKGDGAYLDLKTNIEDSDIKVFHPRGDLKQRVGKYWDKLSTLCSIGKAPVSPDIGDKIFSRLIIIEKVPESVTEDELIERFPEAINVICFPHVKGTKGLRMLEFESETVAMKFLREHKDEEIDGASVRMTKYGRRASEWEDKKDKEDYQTCILPDDDRIKKCERVAEIESKTGELVNREDIFGEEKLVEFQQSHEEKQQLTEQIRSDTDHRKLKKESIPEKEELRTSYTKLAETKEWQRSSRAKRAAAAYGIEKESRKSSRKSRSPSPRIEKDKCFNCGGKGHFARDCPSEKEGVNCYTCGKSGHFARDCGKQRKSGSGRRRSRSPAYDGPTSKRRARSRDRRDSERDRFSFRSRSPVYRDRPMKRGPSPLGRDFHGTECYKCGKGGHYARDCKGDTCFKCGQTGHYSKACPGDKPPSSGKPGKPCFNCGKDGHMAKECPMGHLDTKQRKALYYLKSCFNCGGEGHIAQDCPKGNEDFKQRKPCYSCGEVGHLAKDCPHYDSKQGEICYKCQGSGHYSRDCPSGEPGSRTRTDKCFVCQGEGHFARECPNRTPAPAPVANGSSRDMNDPYRRDQMPEQSEWRNPGMDAMGNSAMGVAGGMGDAGGNITASSDIVANVMRMAGVQNARPTEVAAILQNISQSLSTSVARLERADLESRIGRY